MDHEELVAELRWIEQLPVLKRLELARKRRTLQLVKWHENEVSVRQIASISLLHSYV